MGGVQKRRTLIVSKLESFYGTNNHNGFALATGTSIPNQLNDAPFSVGRSRYIAIIIVLCYKLIERKLRRSYLRYLVGGQRPFLIPYYSYYFTLADNHDVCTVVRIPRHT